MFLFKRPRRPDAADAQKIKLQGGAQTLMLGSSTNSKRLALLSALRADVTLIVLTSRPDYWRLAAAPKTEVDVYDVSAAGSGAAFKPATFAATLRAAARRGRACTDARLPVIFFDGFAGSSVQLIQMLRQVNLNRAHRIVDLDAVWDDVNDATLFAEFSQVALFAIEHPHSIALIKNSIPGIENIQLEQIWRLPADRFHVINFR